MCGRLCVCLLVGECVCALTLSQTNECCRSGLTTHSPCLNISNVDFEQTDEITYTVLEEIDGTKVQTEATIKLGLHGFSFILQ